MALKVSPSEAANIAIQSIGRGYDISLDLRLKYCKGDSRLIEIDEDHGREIILPGSISIPNVSKSIRCDKGERTRFRSDVLSFQQVYLLDGLSVNLLIFALLFFVLFSFSCIHFFFFHIATCMCVGSPHCVVEG